jgi:Xaa-Pro aminopeptidase
MDLKSVVSPLSVATYKKRRLIFIRELAKAHKNFCVLLWSGSELVRNHDSHFQFRALSDFLYLTGFSEPETLAILQFKNGKFKSTIGVRPRDLSPHRGSEIWEGERLGVERAPKVLGFDEAFDIHQVTKIAQKWIAETPNLFWNFGLFPEWDQRIVQMTSTLTLNNRGIPIVENICDFRPVLHELRKVKSPEEIRIMRKSAEIASLGHIRAMHTTRPGDFEYQIAAEVEREFKKGGSDAPAYGSIVASGANACTLHYRANNCQVSANEMVLIDAGAEFKGYASDITRCYPVGGKFTGAQREVYAWVLKSQLAAIRATRAGASLMAPHEAAVRVLCEGLSKMKIIRKNPREILKRGLWKSYMPHGTSHWLGLDVHDSGIYKERNDPSRSVRLAPGHVITVEPGLYFRHDDKTVPAKYRGIGVRIEDDVLVTRRGPDVLTKNCPKTIQDVETACGPRL